MFNVTRMNYGLLALSFLLCGIGLVLEFVFLEPLGFVLDGLGFMLFLYVIFTRERNEWTASDTYRSIERDKENARRVTRVLDRESTWICPECKAVNLNEERVCYHCKRIKPKPFEFGKRD